MRTPSPSSSPVLRVAGPPLAVAVAALALTVPVPSASAAAGVLQGSGNDAAGDAPSGSLDINGADVVYNRNTGRVKGVVRMSGRPPGDVDVLFGTRQASGACSVDLTLNSNVAAGTGEVRGPAGYARGKASVSFANNTVTVAATTTAAQKRAVDCATVNAYGAGANHTLRDTIKPAFDVAERVDVPAEPEFPGETGTETPPGEEPTGVPPEGIDTDGDGIPDDFDGDGIPDDPGAGGVPGGEGGGEGSSTPLRLSVRSYGVPERLRRGRSYEIRIRIRNANEVDVTRLRVRLARKTGVAMSRRVAPVSRVRAGKGVTVHVRLRLTSAERKRTVRVTVTGEGVEERRTIVLRRRVGG